MDSKMTAKMVLDILEGRYHPPAWVFFRELRLGSGYGGKNNKWERRIDAWALNCYPSTGMKRIAFEVKLSRSDFLAELRQPEKRQPAMEVSNEFYFVAPAGLIKVEELPEYCGLVEVCDGRSNVRYFATYRDCLPAPWRFVASVARRTTAAEEEIAQLIGVKAVMDFVERVNRQAEAKMEMTGRLEGAHYAAMQQELAKLQKER